MVSLKGAWDRFKGFTVHPDARRKSDALSDSEFVRNDNLSNDFLGYGTARDKLGYGTFIHGTRLTDLELHAMYYSDDISAKIVNFRHAESFRCGYKLTAKDQGEAEALQQRGAQLFLDDRMLRGRQRGSLYGGALAIFGAVDGGADLAAPLNEKTTIDVRFINVIDRRYASVQQWQDNPLLADYGKPLVYNVRGVYVHASRVIAFDGVAETDPDTRRQLGGWTYSALQRPYDVVRKFATCFDSVAHLMADASQGVFKIKGLIDLIASNKEELLTRLAFSDMTRSAGRAVMVDAEDEDFTRVPTSFAGVGDIIDRWTYRLCAAAELPATVLMGRSPEGMNATGDSDFRNLYGSIASGQENELKPQLLQAYTLIAGNAVPEDLDVEFHPLWEPTALEKATTDKAVADTRKVYVDMGAIMPEQVAIADFGDGHGKIEIDQAALEESLKQEIALMLDPPAEPVGVAAVGEVPEVPADAEDEAAASE